jgi:mannose-6-phosphate isomerase-like protein (cupin superfamily)
LIEKATRIPVPGGKVIDEYVGRVNSGEAAVSVAHMVAPGGWAEPAQTPEFDEYTLVLRGSVRVETATGTVDVPAGSAIVTRAGERIRYSVPDPQGAEYVAVCRPAFAPDLARRDDETDEDSHDESAAGGVAADQSGNPDRDPGPW